MQKEGDARQEHQWDWGEKSGQMHTMKDVAKKIKINKLLCSLSTGAVSIVSSPSKRSFVGMNMMTGVERK